MTTDAASEFITVAHMGEVAVVRINNPPVNALSLHLRQPLFAALEALNKDDTVAAIVLAASGRTFISGADISEFGTPKQTTAPTVGDLINLLEAITKPTIAAIHGAALGGGLEVALVCHYRIADRGAKLGLPEVKLGLLPGAGGTVRTPRLIGPEKALELIVSGTPVDAVKAYNLGLIDAISDTDLVNEAVAFARSKLETGGPHRQLRVRDEKLLTTRADFSAFDALAKDLTRKSRGLEAPLACVEAVRNAVTLPFDEALAAEHALFLKLAGGIQSRAQRHLFFAEREAGKVAGVGKDVPARIIKKIGVIGAGTMGGGIAMAFLNGGFDVTILEVNNEALQRGLGLIDKNYATAVARGSLTDAERTTRLARLSSATDYAALADADLIVEAAFEDMDVKHAIFAKLDAIAKPGAILATNTSYLDINAIAAAISRPADVVGLHFFSPANIMKLLEVVRAEKTAPDVLVTALSVARQIGKIPVVVGVCRGFVGNRMLTARAVDQEDLLLEGASPQQIDQAFTEFGWPMGPFQMLDLAGIDIGWRNRKALGTRNEIADSLAEQGHFGQKTGRGFYLYREGSRTPEPNPDVASLIAEKAAARGITRREIPAAEILERTLLPLVNEGARVLEEKIAARTSDIDLIWVHGYGFPVGRGGPMFWASTEGHAKIAERLQYWFERTGKDAFKPADYWLQG